MKLSSQQGLINLQDRAGVQARRPLLIAHRGGVIAPNAPENSLAAIQLADTHGYDMVELDLQETKDNEPILFHGHQGLGLFVECEVEQDVADLTSDEVATIHYRASTERIPTLAQALRLCKSLNLGVMLDIKTEFPSAAFLQRIVELLETHQLGSAVVDISAQPLVREYLAGHAMVRVTEDDFRRVMDGHRIPLGGQFWFGWACRLPDTAVALLQQNGALVIPSLNTFHYPAHARHALARRDARRLLAAGVDGLQIDSVYEEFFL